MHRQDWEGRAPCASCGEVISPATDGGFAYGTQGVLCWECAIRRGGSYDADQDRWTTPPDVSDLPDERRPVPTR